MNLQPYFITTVLTILGSCAVSICGSVYALLKVEQWAIFGVFLVFAIAGGIAMALKGKPESMWTAIILWLLLALFSSYDAATISS